ncbi:MAG TPA: haloalkane dehalogenase [Gammaproteobacteria bacterium]|nr:haloalkane dehalogenase [Gammaproteobacteria bacterium]
MDIYRTPDECFAGLPDFPFEPHYTEVEGLRVHHVEAGPAGAAPVLLLHGEPTWSFLYRKMIPIIAAGGYRAIAPDLVGFGRSDKPTRIEDYSFARHVGWMADWIRRQDLRDITLVAQDWGSLIGLRLVAEHGERFSRVVMANGFLPTGDQPPPLAFKAWQAFARWSPVFPISGIVRAGCRQGFGRDVARGYAAPFPVRRAKAGTRAFPRLVPTRPTDPSAEANRAAWERLRQWDQPFLTAFATGDPIFGKLDRVLQKEIPGAAGQPHCRIRGAGHFIQEDKGEELAEVVLRFLGSTGNTAPAPGPTGS